MSSMMTRARSQSIHITICHGRTRRSSRRRSCAPAVVKIEKIAKSENIVSNEKKKSTNKDLQQANISIHENTKSPVNRPEPESTFNRSQRTNIFKPRSSKDKIKIVATHKQFSNYNMKSLKEKFEKIDKMSRLDRAHRAAAAAERSAYVILSFIEHAAVETHENGTIAKFSNDFGSSGLNHMKPTAIGDTTTLDKVLVRFDDIL